LEFGMRKAIPMGGDGIGPPLPGRSCWTDRMGVSAYGPVFHALIFDTTPARAPSGPMVAVIWL
jgi:hypothetical protein